MVDLSKTCGWYPDTERFSVCDGKWECFCEKCPSCGKAMQWDYEVCPKCISGYDWILKELKDSKLVVGDIVEVITNTLYATNGDKLPLGLQGRIVEYDNTLNKYEFQSPECLYQISGELALKCLRKV